MATSQLRLERAANLWFNPNPNPMQRNHTVHSGKGRGKNRMLFSVLRKKKRRGPTVKPFFPRSFISNMSSTTLRLHANAEEDFWPFQGVTEFYDKIWKRLLWITKW